MHRKTVCLWLRHNVGFEDIAKRFRLSVPSAGSVFNTSINHIYRKFGQLSIWPQFATGVLVVYYISHPTDLHFQCCVVWGTCCPSFKDFFQSFHLLRKKTTTYEKCPSFLQINEEQWRLAYDLRNMIPKLQPNEFDFYQYWYKYDLIGSHNL